MNRPVSPASGPSRKSPHRSLALPSPPPLARPVPARRRKKLLFQLLTSASATTADPVSVMLLVSSLAESPWPRTTVPHFSWPISNRASASSTARPSPSRSRWSTESEEAYMVSRPNLTPAVQLWPSLNRPSNEMPLESWPLSTKRTPRVPSSQTSMAGFSDAESFHPGLSPSSPSSSGLAGRSLSPSSPSSSGLAGRSLAPSSPSSSGL